ncbi:AMP-dependent synthetase [Mycobacterium sp. IS-1496]|uniref:non-ribosomal peptide synthetase n=1 Tax=Mycobacterium sp. IS-1496 TaxID=1772284 RepID=UPI0007415B2D|nr:non-ribosomal peptide synthetase [Mycobacterium sp. IS-1496]KUI28196.1 AMP-dependent synthetase [Mycobacterium sp. IS-1496]
MSGLVEHLRAQGDRTAVLTDSRRLSYADLADRVSEVAARLGDTRRLVLLETRNDLPTLVHYLGALAGGHVVLPVPAGRDHGELTASYDPDVVVDADGLHPRRAGSVHRLHDDLALLLSTSGSTGSPKLVRLSRRNLLSNARAIADYLDIRESDRAATTLPMSYCYGLSVIHSHLLRGAALILTEHSVVDDEFWALFRRHRGTTFAGVPYTFDLLDSIGFDTMDLPDLRYITQAGGRLAPERVLRYAELGTALGWRLVVMYGATEATARMAYLPPDLAATHPGCIGVPIPGGSFTIEPLDGWPAADAAGELVYRGDNVMMGYAHGSADLSRGDEVEALHTGDIARRRPDGLYEVIGRSSRFVKMYGLRIDLQRLETALRDRGVAALCTDLDDRLVVAAAAPHRPAEVARLAAEAAGVPSSAVSVVAVAELPVLPTGKPDYPAVRALAAPIDDTPPTADLTAVFAEVLHLDRDDIDPDASFVDLGGNSLTYVAMSVRLERALGRLPGDWQRTPLRELQSQATPRRRRWTATLETSVALRAVAIVLIVGSHATLFELWGGAHVLLGIAGYNFGRFCLTPAPRAQRVRHLRTTIAWIAVPSVVWVVIALLVTDDYHLSNLLLANKFLGPHDSMTAGRLWFVEVMVWTLVALAALIALPAADRAERRRPFAFSVGFLAVGLALRYDVLGLDLGREAWFTMLTFWFFAAGWAAAKARTPWQRIAVTAALVVGLYGYFENTDREMLVLAGFVLLIWLPALRCPPGLTVVAGVVGEASLYTYLTHFQVYALFEGRPALGVAASIAVGVLLTRALTLLRRRLRDRRPSVSAAAVPARR